MSSAKKPKFFHEKPGQSVCLEAVFWLSPEASVLKVEQALSSGEEHFPLTHALSDLQVEGSEETACLPSCRMCML